MATYPDTDISHNSFRHIDGGLAIAISPDGKTYTQDSYTTPWYEFNLIHPFITQTEAYAIEAFWETNKSLPFVFVYRVDSLTYINCRFLPGGIVMQREQGNYYTVQTRFRGQKQ